METVRNSQKVWPYCSSCGCRLQIDDKDGFYYFEGKLIVKHFGRTAYPYMDARRHSCPRVNHVYIVDPQEVAYVGA